MKKEIEEYIRDPYTRILIPSDDGSFTAEILEFTGCFADGETADEAMNNLNEAARSWIEACLEQGLEIPEPLMNQGYGGKIALRLPRSLHRQAARMAARDGVSLNQFLVTAIAARVGAEDLFGNLANKLKRSPTIVLSNDLSASYIFPRASIAENNKFQKLDPVIVNLDERSTATTMSLISMGSPSKNKIENQ
jgi:predicted RNase H-like HicB family nuclease